VLIVGMLPFSIGCRKQAVFDSRPMPDEVTGAQPPRRADPPERLALSPAFEFSPCPFRDDRGWPPPPRS